MKYSGLRHHTQCIVLCFDVLQGNLDPAVLRRESEEGHENEAEQNVRGAARELIAKFRGVGHIANLGEGLRGDEDPGLVSLLVDTIHETPN